MKKTGLSFADFEPYCILRTILRNIWMVLLGALIALMGVYLALFFLVKPTYTSRVTFAVTSRAVFGSAPTNVAATSSVTSRFCALIGSPVVKQAVADELGFAHFPAKIQLEVVDGTNIIRMSCAARTPELAFRTALSITRNFTAYSHADVVFETANMHVVNDPSIPQEPDHLKTRQRLLQLAAPFGALCVIALLIYFSVETGTVQTVVGARDQLDGRALASVYHERKHRTLRSLLRSTKRPLLITDPTTTFYYCEAIHQLRAQVEHAHRAYGYRLFLVTSCSENEGKSTISANLALSLAQKNRRVLLLDADLRKPAQQLIFERAVPKDAEFGALLAGDFTAQELERAIVKDEATGLSLLLGSSSRSHSAELLDSAVGRRMLQQLGERYDYVIIDSPPIGLFSDSELLADLADASMLVVRQDLVPAADLNDVIDTLCERGAERFLGYIFNNIHSLKAAPLFGRDYSYGYGYSYAYGYGYGDKKRSASLFSSAARRADRGGGSWEAGGDRHDG